MFNPAETNTPENFFPVTSDDFFASPEMLGSCAKKQDRASPQWDIIFIDGMHTYEQSLRDFKNSLPYSHSKTVWIIHDTLPSDPYSAISDMDLSRNLQELAGYSDFLWFGDVYKTILTIHELYQNFSYCTITDCEDVPMTFLWKANNRVGRKNFSSVVEIRNISFIDLIIDFLPLMNICTSSQLFSLLGKRLDIDYGTPVPYEKAF
jgi:hypothetical protein